MIKPCSSAEDPRIQSALDELKDMIAAKYPDATFMVSEGEDDPEQVHLVVTVDVEDTDDILDLVIDRVLELQIDEGLPVHVIPVRTPKREIEQSQDERFKALEDSWKAFEAVPPEEIEAEVAKAVATARSQRRTRR